MILIHSRSSYIDNLKGILILLVVIGHFNEYIDTDCSHLAVTISNFIYTFHMPLFLLCSGLFVKRSFKPGKNGQASSIICFFLLYILFRIADFLVAITSGRSAKLNLFEMNSGAWYLFVLVCFLIMAPIFLRIKFPFAILFSLALSALNAIYNTQETFLSSSRFFTYLPWFVLGFYITGEKLVAYRTKLKESGILRVIIPIAAALLLIGYFVGIYYLPKDLMSFVRHLSTGMHAFTEMNQLRGISGSMLTFVIISFRLLHYLLVALICLCIMVLCPIGGGKLLKTWGQRSLQIYIIHLLFLYYFKSWHVDALITELGWNQTLWAIFFPLAAGFVCTLILGLFPWPNRWLQKAKSLLDRFVCHKPSEY